MPPKAIALELADELTAWLARTTVAEPPADPTLTGFVVKLKPPHEVTAEGLVVVKLSVSIGRRGKVECPKTRLSCVPLAPGGRAFVYLWSGDTAPTTCIVHHDGLGPCLAVVDLDGVVASVRNRAGARRLTDEDLRS